MIEAWYGRTGSGCPMHFAGRERDAQCYCPPMWFDSESPRALRSAKRRRDEALAFRSGARRTPESPLRIRMQKLCRHQQAPPFFPTAVLLPSQHKFYEHVFAWHHDLRAAKFGSQRIMMIELNF